jgi:mRNA-degrading endonuclease RelE of RelBE toxin-antitoxin system
MVIIELPAFTRRVLELLSDDDYLKLQSYLLEHPDAGPLVRGSGGLRKLRWALQGRGKRGGVRVIYYWAVSAEQLLLLFIYPKSEQADLMPDQMRALRQVIEDEYP